MLLAKCLACTPLDSKWRHPYIAFMVNPGGEYVQSKAGLDLLTLIAKDALVLPAEWSPLHSQLAIVDQNEFCKVTMLCMRLALAFALLAMLSYIDNKNNCTVLLMTGLLHVSCVH